jgi:hypothetical protein
MTDGRLSVGIDFVGRGRGPHEKHKSGEYKSFPIQALAFAAFVFLVRRWREVDAKLYSSAPLRQKTSEQLTAIGCCGGIHIFPEQP